MSDCPPPRIPTQFVAPEDTPVVRTLGEMFGPRAVFPSQSLPEDTEQPQQPEDTDAPERDAEAVAATPAAAAPTPGADGPQPIAAGTYAIYDDQAGGLVLVLGTREGQTHHKHVPARVVKMAEMAMGGASPLSALFGA